MGWKKKYRDRILEAVDEFVDVDNLDKILKDGKLYKIIGDIYMDGFVDGCADVESDNEDKPINILENMSDLD